VKRNHIEQKKSEKKSLNSTFLMAKGTVPFSNPAINVKVQMNWSNPPLRV